MNDYDRSNLEFLLSIKTDEDWQNWADAVDADDLDYAMELIKTAQAENEVFQMELAEALQESEGMDCTLAKNVLDKFKKP